jgi:hypothetical protein
MSLFRSPAVAVWLLAAGAYSIGPAWAGNAQTGKLHPWVLVAVFWGAALLSVSVHYVRQYLPQAAAWTRRAWHRNAPVRARLMRRARLHVARTSAGLSAGLSVGLRRSRQLVRSHALLAGAWSLAHQGLDAANRAWAQQMAGARRAPGALLGWPRSGLRALRAWGAIHDRPLADAKRPH